MKTILIIGAGKSTSALIDYLGNQAIQNNWKIVVADKETAHLEAITNDRISVTGFDVKDDLCRENEIKNADLVISMMPVRFHKFVAQSCLKYAKNLLTASYEPADWKDIEPELTKKGILFLSEMGVDPGLDHMSAMQIIDRLKKQRHELLCFETFTGGLVAPESDDNPWHYKFSWNPRNVVLAGQDGPARFRQEGKYKYIPYNRLFRRTELIEIEGFGKFEGYANRDSLKYIDKYNLHEIPTIYRGTLRRPGFCRAWNVFVQLGATDDSYFLEDVEKMTYRDFINSFLYYHKSDSVETKLYHSMHIDQDSDIIEKLEWMGIFEDKPIGLKKATPAQVMEHLLKQKWQLQPHDKDMTVMWHKFIYADGETGQPVKLTSSMAVTGEDAHKTAMAKTVGLPLGIAADLVLSGRINLTGLQIPTIPEIYNPVLEKLKQFDITFSEKYHSPHTDNWRFH